MVQSLKCVDTVVLYVSTKQKAKPLAITTTTSALNNSMRHVCHSKTAVQYFAGRGRAEFIRIVFAAGGQEFQDVRIKSVVDGGE